MVVGCTLQVLLIGGSTGTMLEALEVVGDGHDGSLGEVSLPVNLCNFLQLVTIFLFMVLTFLLLIKSLEYVSVAFL